MTIQCPHCGALVSSRDRWCPYCEQFYDPDRVVKDMTERDQQRKLAEMDNEQSEKVVSPRKKNIPAALLAFLALLSLCGCIVLFFMVVFGGVYIVMPWFFLCLFIVCVSTIIAYKLNL